MLPRCEDFACVQVTSALREYGVDVRVGQRPVRIGRNGEGYVGTTSDGDCTGRRDVIDRLLDRRLRCSGGWASVARFD